VASDNNSETGPRGRSPLLPLIHGRVRLLILSALLRADIPVSFTDLRKMVELTDGTLSVHLGKREEGKLVKIRKTFVGKRPQTTIQPTARGRRSFRQYIQDLQDIIPGL